MEIETSEQEAERLVSDLSATLNSAIASGNLSNADRITIGEDRFTLNELLSRADKWLERHCNVSEIN